MDDSLTHRFEAAFARHLPALNALPAHAVRRPRLNVTALVPPLLAALPRLEMELVAVAALPGLDGDLVRELPTRVLALVQAQAAHVASVARTPPIAELEARGRVVRGILRRAAGTLIDLGKLPPATLDAVGKRRGRTPLAMDLVALASLFDRLQAASEAGATGQTPAVVIPPELVAEAAALGDQLLTTIGQRERADLRVSEATLLRDRAFTLFLLAYREARRGLDFRLGAAESLVVLPNVFDWRRWGRRRRRGEEGEGGGGEGGEGGGGEGEGDGAPVVRDGQAAAPTIATGTTTAAIADASSDAGTALAMAGQLGDLGSDSGPREPRARGSRQRPAAAVGGVRGNTPSRFTRS